MVIAEAKKKRPPTRRSRRRSRKHAAFHAAIRAAQQRISRNRTFVDRRLERLYYVYERWRDGQINRMIQAGELRYVAFSFQLWMMSERCGWREHDFKSTDYHHMWRWWLRLHIVNQIEIAVARRFHRR